MFTGTRLKQLVGTEFDRKVLLFHLPLPVEIFNVSQTQRLSGGIRLLRTPCGFQDILLRIGAEGSSLGLTVAIGTSKAELPAFPCDILTDHYTATATLWKVEVTASKV